MGGRRRRNRKHRRCRCRRRRGRRRCRCHRNHKLHLRRCRSLRCHLKPTRPLLHRHSLQSPARISPNIPILLRLLARRHHRLAHSNHTPPHHRPCHHSLRRRNHKPTHRRILPHHSPYHPKSRPMVLYTYSLSVSIKARLCSRYQRTTSTILVRAKTSWLLCLVWLTRSA